jgi:hypothetical protein
MFILNELSISLQEVIRELELSSFMSWDEREPTSTLVHQLLKDLWMTSITSSLLHQTRPLKKKMPILFRFAVPFPHLLKKVPLPFSSKESIT